MAEVVASAVAEVVAEVMVDAVAHVVTTPSCHGCNLVHVFGRREHTLSPPLAVMDTASAMPFSQWT